MDIDLSNRITALIVGTNMEHSFLSGIRHHTDRNFSEPKQWFSSNSDIYKIEVLIPAQISFRLIWFKECEESINTGSIRADPLGCN